MFDNEFEREVQKKYPLVTAALEKTLPKIMDTTQIEEKTMPSTDSEIDKMYGKGAAEEAMGEALGMPSGDTPVMTMQEGGEPLKEAIDKYNKAKQEYDRLKANEGRGRTAATPEAIEAARLAMEQAFQVITSLQGAGSSVGPPPAPEPSIYDTVKADVSGNLLDTNRRTYEDVLKQPGVQRIYADLEKMIDQAGIGNVKDTKATGTQAATGVMRDVAAGEAGARLKKAQLELGLVGDIEGDPYGTKAGALTSTKLGILTQGDSDNDKAYGAQAGSTTPFNWMFVNQVHVPANVRAQAGLLNTYDEKPINGKERNFLSVFNEATRDPKIRFFTTGDDGATQAQRQNRFVELLAIQFRQGIFDVERINAALESEFATKAAQYKE